MEGYIGTDTKNVLLRLSIIAFDLKNLRDCLLGVSL